jgi:hypothetical protein
MHLKSLIASLFLFLLFFINSAEAQPLLTGQAVVTSDRQENLSVRVIDTRLRPPFTMPYIGNDWGTPFLSHPSWSYDTIGSVFGIAIDANKYTYLTATRIYPGISFKAGGAGGVYVLDDATWQATVFLNTVNAPVWNNNPTTIPNTGPSLGNIAYDKYNNQLFLTNFEDGKIYRISIIPSGTTVIGNILEVFDPLPANNDVQAGFPPFGDIPWGIGVTRSPVTNTVSVYYGTWSENTTNPGSQNTIGKVDLNFNGSINAGSNNNSFIIKPDFTGESYSNPVSDIEFSLDNKKMITAERSMNSTFHNSTAHRSRVIEYKLDNLGNWIQEPVNKFGVGKLTHNGLYANSSGGVDYEYFAYDSLTQQVSLCDSVVWMTGDALLFPLPNNIYLYGIQGTISSGGDYSTSILQDLDHDLTFGDDKTQIGDVDILRDYYCETRPLDTACMTIVKDTIYCDSAGTGYYYTFQVMNNSLTQSITELEFTVDSPQPPNTVFVNPGFIMPNPPIPPLGVSQPYTIHLTGPGVDTCLEQVCYTLSATLDGVDCPTCCFIENCLKLPCCDACGEVSNDSIYCVNGQYYFSFTLTNLSGFTVNKVQITSPVSNGLTFVPSNFTNLTLLNGQSMSQTVQVLNGIAGQSYPVRFKLFWGTTECCYFEKTYTLPPCSDSCGCGEWRYRYYTVADDTTRRAFKCNTTLIIPGGQNFNLFGDYFCSPSDTALCNDSYEITTRNMTTGNTVTTIQSSLLSYSFLITDNFQVTLKVFCGGMLCDSCSFIIKKSGTSKVGDTKLMQNYPNPFNPATQISFYLPLDLKVSVKIYDITGRLVKTLINNEQRSEGVHTVEFDGSSFASGIYFYRLETEGYTDTKKMLIVK